MMQFTPFRDAGRYVCVCRCLCVSGGAAVCEFVRRSVSGCLYVRDRELVSTCLDRLSASGITLSILNIHVKMESRKLHQGLFLC